MSYRTANRRANRASDFLRKRGEKTGREPMALPVARKPVSNHTKARASRPGTTVPPTATLRGEASYPNGKG